jgi:dTDP-glucose 4,6-dehydratase
MSKILVTGATGFIGSHLIPQLLKKGYDVFALERYVTQRYAKYKECKTVFGDIRSHFIVQKIIREVVPDVVIHLASVSPVSYSFDHPYEVLDTNLYGTINLAESCLREQPDFKLFLFASTSEVYGFCNDNPKTEESKPVPNSPYSVSKYACEHYLRYLNKTFDFPMVILRNFNTFGRRENYHFLIEKSIVQMLSGESCCLGDPNPVRDFMYVEDHVNSYLTCLERASVSIGETFNFCTGRGVSIKEVVDKIADLIGFNRVKRQKIISWDAIPSRPSDIQVLVGSYDKARRILGWQPKWALEEGLKETISYWKKQLEVTCLK